MFKRFFVAAMLSIAAMMACAPAHAGLFLCNNTGTTLYTAVAWYDSGWQSKGWWKIEPRDCALPLAGNLSQRQYYYYAYSVDRQLEWGGANDPSYFCISDGRFHYSYAAGCKGHNFRKVEVGESNQYTVSFTETREDAGAAAIDCAAYRSSGVDAFAKCWMRRVATAKQRQVLDCYDATRTWAGFGVCAASQYLSQDQLATADCIDRFARNSGVGDLALCLGRGNLSQQQANLLNCVARGGGDVVSMGSCVVGSELTPDQQRIVACVEQNRGSYQDMALCAAGTRLSPEQQRIAGCVMNNRGSYMQMGICAVGNHLTPEQQAFIECAMTSGGQPWAYAGCVGTRLTMNELQKCIDRGIGGDGCFGVNNTAVQLVRNAWKDVTEGPGPGNELLGYDGALIRTYRNNIQGPVGDIARGEIGGSDASVWRQVGLPRIRLW